MIDDFITKEEWRQERERVRAKPLHERLKECIEHLKLKHTSKCDDEEKDLMISITLEDVVQDMDHRRQLCHPVWDLTEITAIEKLAEMKDIDAATVVRQSVRQYQAVAHGACTLVGPNYHE